MTQKLTFTSSLEQSLIRSVTESGCDRLFVLTDEHTRVCCWEKIQHFDVLRQAQVISIAPGDEYKNIDTLTQVWTALRQGGATRNSLMMNLGGGMVSDLGGFAAATFKRGIAFINLPTTLLAMIDAAVGGKTGVNFDGLKNEIGVFSPAQEVIFHTPFLQTLDRANMLSGYAEMLKHGLLENRQTWSELLLFNIVQPDVHALESLVSKSVEVKRRIVEQDPTEKGLRKALNLGHTFGHAFESYSLAHHSRPILHGYAVAYGLVADLYLSARLYDFPKEILHQCVHFIREYYGMMSFTCEDYAELTELMRHDKKNQGNRIMTTLLADIGKPLINCPLSEEQINEALDFCREG